MNFQDLFKLDRPLTQREIHQLIAGAILSFTESDRPMQPAELVNAESCAVQLGATGSCWRYRSRFYHFPIELKIAKRLVALRNPRVESL